MIETLIEYFKAMAADHVDIQGFITGEEYEQNHSLRQYPLLWFKFPISSEPVVLTNGDTLTTTINIAVLTNLIKDEFGNEIVIRESSVSTPSNLVGLVGIPAQDRLIENTFAILNQIIQKMLYDIEEGTFEAVDFSATINTEERYTNDDVYSSVATITFSHANTYACNYKDFFRSLQ